MADTCEQLEEGQANETNCAQIVITVRYVGKWGKHDASEKQSLQH